MEQQAWGARARAWRAQETSIGRAAVWQQTSDACLAEPGVEDGGHEKREAHSWRPYPIWRMPLNLYGKKERVQCLWVRGGVHGAGNKHMPVRLAALGQTAPWQLPPASLRTQQVLLYAVRAMARVRGEPEQTAAPAAKQFNRWA